MYDQLIALGAGTLIGFAMAIPVGPVGLIVFQRSMLKSRLLGLVTGLGSSLTDGFLAAIGAFGIKIVWDFIEDQQTGLRIAGGVIILLVGLVTVFSKYKPNLKKKDTAITLFQHFISGIVLTATNPLAAFTFFVIFARIGHKLGIGGEGIAPALVGGVVIGSFLWWLTLTHIGKTVGHKVKPEHIDLINKCFGLAITLIGSVMLLGAFLR